MFMRREYIYKQNFLLIPSVIHMFTVAALKVFGILNCQKDFERERGRESQSY